MTDKICHHGAVLDRCWSCSYEAQAYERGYKAGMEAGGVKAVALESYAEGLRESFAKMTRERDRLREAATALVESWETDSHGFRQSGYEDCAQALRAVLGEEP